jgi:hypothetical protein
MGGVVGAQAPQSGGAGTGKYGGMANQGGGANPFQQYQGAGVQQASPGNSYYPQTATQQQTYQQMPQAGAGKYGGMTGQQSVPQGVPPEVSQQYQQQQQRPFQAQQPNYGALFSSLASMFGGQQGRAPFSNYQPLQSANNFQLRNTYQFDPATDPSRQYAARVKAEADQKAADAEAAKAAADAASQAQPSFTDPGPGGNARGGRINSPDKKIRAALLTAKGVQAKAVPSSQGIDNVHTVIDTATVDHPAADIPGIHLRAGRMGKAIGGGSFSGPKYPDVEKLAQAHDKFIYHSGTVDDLDNMKWGLEPQHGSWIQELANHAGDMEPEEILDRATPLVWFSDSPSWVAMKVARKLDKPVSNVTENEICQHGHVAIVPRKGDHASHIYHVGEEGLNNGAYSNVKDLTGKTKKAYETELYDDNKEPFGVERNEYVSAKEVEPLLHLTGDHLVNFLRAVKRRGQPVGKSGGGALAAPGAHEEDGGRVGYAGGGGEDDPVVQQALGLTQQAQPSAPQMARKLNDQGLYSHAAEAAAALPQAKGSPQQMLAMLSSRGVKPDEIKHSGAQDTFGGQKAVTKDELAQHFEQNMPEIQETVLKDGETKYKNYQLPKEPRGLPEDLKHQYLEGAEMAFKENEDNDSDWINNFRNEKEKEEWMHDWAANAAVNIGDIDHISDWHKPARTKEDNYREILLHSPVKNQNSVYENSHWDEPNVIGHIRASDRDDGKTLHVEEIQSDWGQDKRKGKDVPEHPLVGNTNAWTDLLLKRVLHEAAHGGYDRIAWTQGQDQAGRYNLSKYVNRLAYDPEDKELSYYDKKGGWKEVPGIIEPENIHEHVGKEVAEKLLAQPPSPLNGRHILDNLNLTIGGEGMKSYYDKIVPNRIMDVAKKAGVPVKVEPHNIDTAEGEKALHSIRMTPELRAAIMRGLPVYKNGGRAGYNVSNSNNNSVVRRALDLTKGMN